MKESNKVILLNVSGAHIPYAAIASMSGLDITLIQQDSIEDLTHLYPPPLEDPMELLNDLGKELQRSAFIEDKRRDNKPVFPRHNKSNQRTAKKRRNKKRR